MRALAFILALMLADGAAAQTPRVGAMPVTGGTFTGPVSQSAKINILSRLAGAAALDNPQLNQPMMVPTRAVSTLYGSGEIVSYDTGSGIIYFEQQQGPSCTSASSGAGPTTVQAAGTYITDGTCLWGSTFVAPVGGAPTITSGQGYPQTATSFPAGSYTGNVSGSGSSQVVNFYSSSGGTTAPTGSIGTATFAGTVMTIASCSPCTFAPGQMLTFAGQTGFPVITTQAGGTTGGIGTYNLSVSQSTIGSATGVTEFPHGPTGTGTFNDGTVTWTFLKSAPIGKSYVWNGGAGSLPTVANLYGGTPTGAGPAFQMYSLTQAGTFTSGLLQRFEFVSNSPQVVVETFENGTGVNSVRRYIVCAPSGVGCHYVSPNHIGIQSAGGFYYTMLDFSAVGGRAPRDIIVEMGPGSFQGVFGATGDDFYKPAGTPILTMADVGDSYPNGNGVLSQMWAFPRLVADTLGIRNVVNTAIGACGYATALCPSGGLIDRITDVTRANNGAPPDILLVGNGSNDQAASETPATIAAYQTAYLQSIRATPGMSQIPIFLLGIYAHGNGGTSCATCVTVENAEAAAVAAMNDPNTFFCPWTTDAAGAWETGTGNVASQNGGGNADFQFNGANGHDNAQGNRAFAARVARCIQNNLNLGNY